MKTNGAPRDLSERRDPELLRLWNTAKHVVYEDKEKRYNVFDVYQLMSTMPCNGFYVGDETAWRYIMARRRGKTPQLKSKYKRMLYEKLYAIVMELRTEPRYAHMSTKTLMYKAMNYRAPCIGLSPARIRSEIERLHYTT